MTKPHHRPTPWLLSDYEHRDDFTVASLPDGQGFLVTGVCPGCGGRIRREWLYGTGNGYKGVFGRRRTLRCNCGNVHADRPAEEHLIGCGAFWTVELT
jgi:hypothetical protein